MPQQRSFLETVLRHEDLEEIGGHNEVPRVHFGTVEVHEFVDEVQRFVLEEPNDELGEPGHGGERSLLLACAV